MPRISHGSILRRSDSNYWYAQFRIEGILQRESTGTVGNRLNATG